MNYQKNILINIKAFIFGKNKNFLIKKLKGKIKFENFNNLKMHLKKFYLLSKTKIRKKTIFFSPCAASFDSFKNFEDRGFYFNKLIKKYLNG